MTAPTEAKAPCPLAVMDTAAAYVGELKDDTPQTDVQWHRLCDEHIKEFAEARAKVAELVRKAGNLSDYLDAYLAWRREQGGDQFLTDIAEHDIQQFRAALAAFSEVR